MGQAASSNTMASSANSFAAGASFVQGISSIASAYDQSEALKLEGEFSKNQYEFNAKMAERQGADAIRRGATAASRVRQEGRQVKGAQRAALAAQGVDVNSGTAMDIQEQTDAFSELDALTVTNNAWREAWGYKIQATDLTSRGQMAQAAAKNQAQNTLLTGGLNSIGYGLQFGEKLSKAVEYGGK